MTDPDANERWAADLAAWQARMEPVLAEIRQVRIFVLSWGPGPHRPEYAKRIEIIEDLRAHSASNTVMTSEDLMGAAPEFGRFGDPLDAEAIHAQMADLIIALLVPDATVTGVRAELLDIRRNPHIVSKVRLIVPKRVPPGRGLLDIGAKSVPAEHTFRYTQRQFNLGVDLREKCRQWVEEARVQKFTLERARLN